MLKMYFLSLMQGSDKIKIISPFLLLGSRREAMLVGDLDLKSSSGFVLSVSLHLHVQG